MRLSRKSIRLPEYDYSLAGMYFITVSSHQMRPIFGSINNHSISLSKIGKIVKAEWERTALLRPYVKLDDYVIMPNHFHGIIALNHRTDTARRVHTKEEFSSPAKGSIPTIIRAFKSAVTKAVHQAGLLVGEPVWRQRFYEHVIRNEKDLERIREYIIRNPENWDSVKTGND